MIVVSKTQGEAFKNLTREGYSGTCEVTGVNEKNVSYLS